MVAAPRMRFLRPFVSHLVNPIIRPFAGWLPGFAVLTHVGRRSGRVHRTPINVFRRGDRYVFALTYGSDVHWVKNILAAGWCEMRTRGRDIRLVDPELFVDAELRLMPRVLRPIGRLNRVSEVLQMRAAT